MLLATSLIVQAKAPDKGSLLSGFITCEVLGLEDVSVEYSAYFGHGMMSIKEGRDTLYRRDIFLTKGTRCSSYGGGCHTVVNAFNRLGSDTKITVDPDGEDYNSPDFYSVRVINDNKIEIRDSGEYHSRLHLSVGYKGAPAPFDTRGTQKMVCTGDLFHSIDRRDLN